MDILNMYEDTKKLGFGLMRLPLKDDQTVDMDQTKAMVDQFMRHGFTYFDTAYVYHNGTSENVIREALVERYPRESYTMATKLPGWAVNSFEDRNRILDEQLAKTGLTYFDYYLLHAVGKNHLDKYDHFDCWNWGVQMKAEGKIRHIGFSFHDTPELLDELLAKHPEMEFVQLQINYLDWDNEAVRARECYEVACKYNKPVIVMEPVKGGMLAALPEVGADVLRGFDASVSQASFALRFCASMPLVKMVLSGMSNMAQMEDNIRTMDDFKPLSEDEFMMLDHAVKRLQEVALIGCTGCRYCTACPQQIQIPEMIAALNHVRVFGKQDGQSQKRYDEYKQQAAASMCLACGKCEQACPQHLSIVDILKEVAATFES